MGPIPPPFPAQGLVFQNVAFGPLHMGLSESEVRVRVDSALEAVRMSTYKDLYWLLDSSVRFFGFLAGISSDDSPFPSRLARFIF